MKTAPAIRQAADRLLGLLYPGNCLGCGRAADKGAFSCLCPFCQDELIEIRPPACAVCGAPFYGVVETARHCPNCREMEPVFSRGRALLLHRGAGARYIHALKYRQALYLLEDVRRLVRRTSGLAEYAAEAVLVPVPLHPRRQRERGYNQSVLLAECFAAETGVPLENLLRRVKDTPTQTRLTREQRRDNVRGAFTPRPQARFNSRRYILVDDVITTGATLNECAQVILDSRPLAEVKVLTLAHG